MKIELKRAAEDFSEKIHLEEEPEVLELEAEGVTFEKPVEVDLLISKSQDQWICRGKVTTPLKLGCSRCLSEYKEDSSSDLNFVIDFAGNRGEMDTEEEEGYFVVDPTATFFEIDDLVREAIILALPLKPLCAENCKGLCPVCGSDLNKSQCHCVIEKSDPRWEKLKGLLSEKWGKEKKKIEKGK